MKLSEYLRDIAAAATATELQELRAMIAGDGDLSNAGASRVLSAIGTRFEAIRPKAISHRHTWYLGKCRECGKSRKEFDAQQKQKHSKKGAR